jgi:hypothetical protein
VKSAVGTARFGELPRVRLLTAFLGGLLSGGCWVDRPVYIAPGSAGDATRSAHVVESGEPPAPARVADADQGVVVLEAPLARRDARQAVRRFFDAVERESQSELDAVMTSDAVLYTGAGSGTQVASKAWAARFKRLDYEPSGSRRVFRDDELELYEPDELARLAPPRVFALSPRAGQLLAVVNVRDRRAPGAPRRFGARIEFILESSATRTRIREVFEDFRLP